MTREFDITLKKKSLSTTCHRLVYSANKKIKSAIVVSRPRLVSVETSIDASQSHIFFYMLITVNMLPWIPEIQLT